MGKRKSKSQMEKERREKEEDRIYAEESDREFEADVIPKAKEVMERIRLAGANLTKGQMEGQRYYQEWAERIHGEEKPPCWDFLKDYRRPVE